MSVFFERALLAVGLCCLGWYGLAAADAAYKEREARAAIERALAAAGARATRPAPVLQSVGGPQPTLPLEPTSKTPAVLEETPRLASALASASRTPVVTRPKAEVTFNENVVGLLEIPRLGFSTPVLEGDDYQTLRGAAGHLPDTPHPWEKGNSAIAAHRDGIFRPLRNIRVGDELRVQTARGEIRYKVSDTHIVRPTDLSVLDAKTPHMLTLITCYPFNYIGAAPKRFIVHAERIVE